MHTRRTDVSPMMEPSRHPWPSELARLLVQILLSLLILALVCLDARDYALARRGVETGLDPRLPALQSPRLAINVELDPRDRDRTAQILDRAAGLGAHIVRLRLPWSEIHRDPGQPLWDPWDRLADALRARHLSMIATLDTSPAWARPNWEGHNPYAPPTAPDDYARFAAEVAERYGDVIVAYAIWDQPNISPHWGTDGPIDPGGYVSLLAAASSAIRDVAPEALIMSAACAPTTESGGLNMSEVRFLREIYRLGGARHFDIVGVKAYGFWSGPDDRRLDESVLNFSRVILLRQEMRRHGDVGKPIWAVDGGWCSLPDPWSGAIPPQGSDTPAIQASRLDRALERIHREWPWMTLVALQHTGTDAPTHDPAWGFSLWDTSGAPTALWAPIASRLREPKPVYPGVTPLVSALDSVSASAPWTSVWGTDIWAMASSQKGVGTLTLLADGQPSADPLRHLAWRGSPASASIDVTTTGETGSWTRIATGLAPETHGIRVLTGQPPPDVALSLRVGNRPGSWRLWRALFVGALALAALVGTSLPLLRRRPWAHPWSSIERLWQRVPEPAQLVLMGAALVAAVCAPAVHWRWVALLVAGALALLRPDHILVLTIIAVPWAPIHTDLGLGSFSLTEMAILLAVGARLGAFVLGHRGAKPEWTRGLRSRAALVDALVCLLALLAIVGSVRAVYQHEALRELRLVVIEPILLYALVRRYAKGRAKLSHVAAALVVSGAAVAFYALARYPSAGGVIEAEGVRRARGFFGSPNNLALYLERVLPLALAVALWGPSRRSRWAHGAAAVLIGLAALLTFSRGSLVLGVPAGLLVLAVWGRVRARWWLISALAAPVVVVALISGGQRLASLAQPLAGTGALRFKLWRSSLQMLRDHIWFGVGPDNFLYYYGDYILAGAEVDRWLSHPHNLILDFALRLGILGALLGLALPILALSNLYHVNRRTEGQLGTLALGLAGGVVAMLLHGMVDASFFVPELACWLMITLAWSIQTRHYADDD